MGRDIEDFVNSLPTVSGYDEARRIFQEAKDPSIFERIELSGSHELSREGTQMVYVIGRGDGSEKSSWDDNRNDELIFYSACKFTGSFFGQNDADDHSRVKTMPIDRIYEIKRMQPVPEQSYSRQREEV